MELWYERIVRKVKATGKRRRGKNEREPCPVATGFDFNGFPALDLSPPVPSTSEDFASLSASISGML
jgi:hypothetical protein